MDRGACQATIQGVTIIRQDLETKPPPTQRKYYLAVKISELKIHCICREQSPKYNIEWGVEGGKKAYS